MKREHPSFSAMMREAMKDPAEAAVFLDVAFEDFQQDKDLVCLLHCISIVADAQGISASAITPDLTEHGDGALQSLNSLLGKIGYRLTALPVKKANGKPSRVRAAKTAASALPQRKRPGAASTRSRSSAKSASSILAKAR